MTLFQDKDEYIWIGTWGGGVYRFDPSASINKGEKAFTSFLKEAGRLQSNGRYNNAIRSIIQDREDNICFSSLTQGGITRFDGETFTNYTEEDGICFNFVSCFYEDKSGNIWFGSETENGLCIYDGQRFTPFQLEEVIN